MEQFLGVVYIDAQLFVFKPVITVNIQTAFWSDYQRHVTQYIVNGDADGFVFQESGIIITWNNELLQQGIILL